MIKKIWNISSKKALVKSARRLPLPACDPTKEVCEPRELGKIII